ncbi:discoidin domain-containing protein [uncultured Amnibacterium sp.]|uniref:galactose-binding domain-containing protein n=1 Tax=uncultured Amnibacterium sp. TaxID=1631851 RepID=UPI0035CC3DB8
MISAPPAHAAPYTATTGDGANTYAAAPRFTCSDRIAADSPLDWWKLSETTGTTAIDQTAARPGTYSASGVTYRDAGPCPADGDSAVTLSGAANVGVTTATAMNPGTLTTFTEEILFRTTTTAGGLLMGAWASPTSSSGNRDRVVFMAPSGQIVFGMFDTATSHGVTATSTGSYNDSAWHLVDAVYSPVAGLRLFIDGTSVATAAPVSLYTAANLYWRIGFGDVAYADWTPNGTSSAAAAFTGTLADAAVYGSALTTTQVTNHAAAVSGAQDYAEGRNASQSSTGATPPGPAGRAVDGNTDGVYANGSVTHTNVDPNPWWMVDLDYTITVSQIRLWNRTDCCGSRLADYWVFASSAPIDTSLTPAQQAATAGVWSTHVTTAPSPSATITPPGGTSARYVMVQLNVSANLSLAEVQVYGSSPVTSARDLAKGTTANQSSTAYGGAASRAVDGNTDGVFNDGSVTHTNTDTNSWWTTDLGATRSLSSIGVWNRTDCCGSRLSDYWVFVSSSAFNTALTPAAQATQPGVWSVHLTSAPSPFTTVPLPAGQTGRYVMVQEQTANQNLSLAEVQAFGP